MQAAVPSSSAACSGGSGHWSDSGTHTGGGNGGNGDHYDTAATASDVFRDFTWYSAMLLSHLFALEHAQVARDAAAEEARRRTAVAHSPQLLMRAAMAAAKAPTTTSNTFVASPVVSGGKGDLSQSLSSHQSSKAVGEDESSPTMEGADEAPTLLHLTTQHRPHILLSFTVNSPESSHPVGSEENILSEAATRWTAPAKQSEGKSGSPADMADTSSSATTTKALLDVFDAFYFPSELFPSPNTNTHGTSAAASNNTSSGAIGSDSAPLIMTTYDGEEDSGMNRMGAVAGATTSVAGPAGAPRVTPEALREAFHTLLLLGQRCAAFALTFNGIIGVGDGTSEDIPVTTAAHNVDSMCASSEDEFRNPSSAGATGQTDQAARQQAASASLQFMLQLACSCPCAPLSYAAQLCLAHALAVQPPPRCAAGWAARKQLLHFLPTLQPPSRALATTMDAIAASSGVHYYPNITAGTTLNPTASGSAASAAASTSSGSAVGGNLRNRVPATQYVRAEDPMLWFDPAGVVHVTTAQWWWETQQRSRGTILTAYCGPLPATTALPTVQRLLMEEDQYMGPNGSAAAVLLSVMDAVSTEVTLSARAMPGGSSSSLMHTSLRRRRVAHNAGVGGSSSHSVGGLNGGRQTSISTTAGQTRSASSEQFDAPLELEGGSVHSGSPTLPRPSSGRDGTNNNSRGSPATVTAAVSAVASTFPRLSKAAKRRRALLFALAQSHLLPPILQLATSKTLLYGVFTDGGECPSYYLLLSLYPDILRAHHASLHYVLFEDGPLAVDVRLMVATMAASRHRCEYLVSRFSALLLRYAEEAMLEEGQDDDMLLHDPMENYDAVLRNGGGGEHGVHGSPYGPRPFDTDGAGGYHDTRQTQQQQRPCRGQARQRWIMHGPPARLRAVRHLIAIAAHTPWTLNENDIRSVLAEGWTIPEVFQLIAIVAQVVPLCSFVMGMFVPAEPWTMTLLPLEVVERLGHRAVAEEASAGGATNISGGRGGMVRTGSSGALSGLRRVSNIPSDAMSGACPGPATPHQTASSRSLFGIAIGGSGDTTMHGGGSSSAGLTPSNAANGTSQDVYRRYAGEDNIVSEQRIKGSNATANPHTLWRSQFTWNEVGATSMEQYYPGAATLMSEEIECFFDVVRQLTKADCVGLMSPDYTPSYAFRSLQLYVQNLLGFMVEDYPYNDINKVLRRPAKWFAQVLTMRPETLTRSEVVRWYVPTTPPIGKSSDLSAESSLVTHQLKREIELLSVVDSAQGGHRGGIESASAHPDVVDSPLPTPAEAARDAMEAEALQTALTLQDERVLLLIALATMEARKEGLLHILLRPVCAVLSNM